MSIIVNLSSQVTSKDLDPTKFSEENLTILHISFPDKSITSLAQYLSANKNDVLLAKDNIINNDRWFAARYPILRQDIFKVLEEKRVYVRGFDKEGHPLLIYRARYHDYRTRSLEELAKLVSIRIHLILCLT